MTVYMLEYDWVELLQEEGANVNTTGTPDNCSYARPTWISQVGNRGERIRSSIRELLKRHGAEDPGNNEDGQMEDDYAPGRDESEICDQTMHPDIGNGHLDYPEQPDTLDALMEAQADPSFFGH
ncbi:hypothetical protein F5Y12DRAFT_713674 [Xylaria sp. FL1777]|nr:hypothetical protein F5Y12DRAFT_713674 [Xylaria sp. FL1777]